MVPKTLIFQELVLNCHEIQHKKKKKYDIVDLKILELALCFVIEAKWSEKTKENKIPFNLNRSEWGLYIVILLC